MTHPPVSELGHHHEVSDAVLRQRLEEAAESARYWKRHAVNAESPKHRTHAQGLTFLWLAQVSVIEREVRRRHRLSAV